MREVATYTATIYAGLREGYGNVIHPLDDALAVCQRYCDRVGLGVTVTATTFVYTSGREPGCAVGLIHYPRFPHDDPAAKIERLRQVLHAIADAVTRPLTQGQVLEQVRELVWEGLGR